MAVPFIDTTAQHQAMLPELTRAFERVVTSGQFVLGPIAKEFEQALAAYVGVKHAIGVSSGADALTVTMMAMGIGPGDEVVTSPLSYLHTAGAISRLGAKPVFADINARTFNIDPQGIAAAITPKTKAVIVVHLFGLPANMDAIREVTEPAGIKVIEDADQAIGARYKGQHVGTQGDVGTLSFFPTKNLAALGDAGACLTDNDELAERIRTMRFHGIEPGYSVTRLGGAFRLDAMQAAMLMVKLPYVDRWTHKRREIAERYRQGLDDVQVTCPFEDEKRYHAFNQYTLRVRAGGRDPLRHHLTACGIENKVYYPRPLHLQPCFAHLGIQPGELPEAEQACNEVLSIPIFTDMTHEQQDEVIKAIRDMFVGD